MFSLSDMQAWLRRFEHTRKTIDFQTQRLDQLREQAESPSSPKLDGLPRSPSPDPDKIGKSIALLGMIEDRIAGLTMQYQEMQTALQRLIWQAVKRPESAMILETRYLDRQKWEDVLFSVYGDRPDYFDKMDSLKRLMFQRHREGLQQMAKYVSVTPSFRDRSVFLGSSINLSSDEEKCV